MKALNFGSLNLDYVYQVEHFVQPGETLSALRQTVNPGGKGLNQSIALARAGAVVYHAGCVGQGGALLRQTLEDSGVNTAYLRETDALQGNAVIQVDRSGQNCILLYGGSNRSLTTEQIQETMAQFSPGDWLVLQNETNLLPELVDAGFARGMQVVLNPSPYNETIAKVDLSKVNWLLVNEVEARQCSGAEEPERVWAYLHERYPALSLLVTLGSGGSAAFTGAEHVRQSAFTVKAVDTTAAGDTFTGYFIAGLMEGRPLADCLRRASMAAAISVTRPGAAPSIPARDEVECRLQAEP